MELGRNLFAMQEWKGCRDLSLCPPSSGIFQGSRNNESLPVAQVVKEASSLGQLWSADAIVWVLCSSRFVCPSRNLLLQDYEEVGPVGSKKVMRLHPQEGGDFPDEVA